MKMAEATYYRTGRRKTSVARVRLVAGQGNIVINGRVLDDYFDLKTLEIIVKQPLELTGTTAVYDVIASVKGGGASGQAGAIRHGISRALLEVDPEYRKILKSAGLLTRDPRMKERKKYGLKKARKASQGWHFVAELREMALQLCFRKKEAVWMEFYGGSQKLVKRIWIFMKDFQIFMGKKPFR